MVEVIYFPKRCQACGSVLKAVVKFSARPFLDCPNPKCPESRDYEDGEEWEPVGYAELFAERLLSRAHPDKHNDPPSK